MANDVALLPNPTPLMAVGRTARVVGTRLNPVLRSCTTYLSNVDLRLLLGLYITHGSCLLVTNGVIKCLQITPGTYTYEGPSRA